MKRSTDFQSNGEAEHKPRWSVTILVWLAAGLVLINIVLLIFQSRQPVETELPLTSSPTLDVPLTPAPSATTLPVTQTPAFFPSPTPLIAQEVVVPTPTFDTFHSSNLSQGTVLLSVARNGYSNLAIFTPKAGLVTFAPHPWDELDPALSGDGHFLAFSSKRNGYWNIYVMDLTTFSITPITDTPEYDGNPTWSPDSKYLLFETYTQNHFRLQLAELSTGVVTTSWLTPADENSYDADWSPTSNRIVYIREIAGSTQLAFLSISNGVITVDTTEVNGGYQPAKPAFSPDGQMLCWSATYEGRRWLFTADLTNPGLPASSLGLGDEPAWSPDGSSILGNIHESNSSFLTGYHLVDGSLLIPPVAAPGSIHGTEWGQGESADRLLEYASRNASLPLVSNMVLTPVAQTNRYSLSPLSEVNLEYPYLHDAVDESFTALRIRLSSEAGWDILASLQAAFLPVSQPPEAASEWDWLYTGRAILLNRLPLEVGWMAIAREDIGDQTFWRVYLRPLTQDGSLGTPVHAQAWDLYTRYRANPGAYEHGGERSASPLAGYWVDLTEISARYGWQRLSALPEWITYLPASRFGIFVNAPGLSWVDAMMELYPSSIIPQADPQQAKTIITTPVKTNAGPQPTLHPTWTPSP